MRYGAAETKTRVSNGRAFRRLVSLKYHRFEYFLKKRSFVERNLRESLLLINFLTDYTSGQARKTKEIAKNFFTIFICK